MCDCGGDCGGDPGGRPVWGEGGYGRTSGGCRDVLIFWGILILICVIIGVISSAVRGGSGGSPRTPTQYDEPEPYPEPYPDLPDPPPEYWDEPEYPDPPYDY